jgi:polar amino acid transport system substrate-binding protein
MHKTNFFSIKKLIAATAISVAFVGSQAHADQLSDIKKQGVLVCGVLGTDEPFSYIKDPASREIVGYDVDLCDAIAKHLGVKPQLKQLAVAARVPELAQGRVDLLAATLTHNKEREALIDFSLTTFVMDQKIMVKKSSGIENLAALAGKKVLTVKGSTMEQEIRSKIPGAVIVSFDSNPQAFLSLQQGKGSGYVNDETSLRSALGMSGEKANQFQVLSEPLASSAIALGIRKDEPAFKEEVNKTLRELEANGEADKLFAKWFGPGTRMNFPSRQFKIESDKID